jgi:hypothetical protein
MTKIDDAIRKQSKTQSLCHFQLDSTFSTTPSVICLCGTFRLVNIAGSSVSAAAISDAEPAQLFSYMYAPDGFIATVYDYNVRSCSCSDNSPRQVLHVNCLKAPTRTEKPSHCYCSAMSGPIRSHGGGRKERVHRKAGIHRGMPKVLVHGRGRPILQRDDPHLISAVKSRKRFMRKFYENSSPADTDGRQPGKQRASEF